MIKNQFKWPLFNRAEEHAAKGVAKEHNIFKSSINIIWQLVPVLLLYVHKHLRPCRVKGKPFIYVECVKLKANNGNVGFNESAGQHGGGGRNASFHLSDSRYPFLVTTCSRSLPDVPAHFYSDSPLPSLRPTQEAYAFLVCSSLSVFPFLSPSHPHSLSLSPFCLSWEFSLSLRPSPTVGCPSRLGCLTHVRATAPFLHT